jgi:hypothetical protein
MAFIFDNLLKDHGRRKHMGQKLEAKAFSHYQSYTSQSDTQARDWCRC